MPSKTRDKFILAATIAGLALFNEINLLPAEPEQVIAHEVPAFSDYEGEEKKQAFFDWLKPIVESENALIQNQRMRLLGLQSQKPLSKLDQAWLTHISDLYDYELSPKATTAETIKQLLKRVNTIPVELALTQAAIESGWGTSRFAQQANNLFGQWCNVKGCGLVPLRRAANKTHEVKRFSTVNQSVKAYLLNLNTHPAYKSLRNKRAALVKIDKDVTAEDLARTLNFYSERGVAYVQDLLRFIRKNKHLM